MDLKTALPFILDYYNCEVYQMISPKYGCSAMDAYKNHVFEDVRDALQSRTPNVGS